MKTTFLLLLMALMTVTPSWACDGICPMAQQVKASAAPCPHNQATAADKSCDGLMLLSDCLDLTVTTADMALPQAISLYTHHNGDGMTAVALLPENPHFTIAMVRAPPQLTFVSPIPLTPVYFTTQRLRL